MYVFIISCYFTLLSTCASLSLSLALLVNVVWAYIRVDPEVVQNCSEPVLFSLKPKKKFLTIEIVCHFLRLSHLEMPSIFYAGNIQQGKYHYLLRFLH